MNFPKSLIIEYEDGSTRKIEYSKLDMSVRLELSRSGLCPYPDEIQEKLKDYILLHWKSGWQEVIGLKKGVVDLLRYYVLERMEEVGRLVLETNDEYPTLVSIQRLPKDLERVMIIGDKNPKVYRFEAKIKREEGDKIERIEFDRAERHFRYDFDQQAKNWFGEIIDTLKYEIKRRGLTVEQILSGDQSQREKEYKEFAKALNLRASERQQDLYGFIQLILKNIL